MKVIRDYAKTIKEDSVSCDSKIEVKSKASTLAGINTAIKRACGDNNLCFESEKDLQAEIAGGYVTFYRDGFVIRFL